MINDILCLSLTILVIALVCLAIRLRRFEREIRDLWDSPRQIAHLENELRFERHCQTALVDATMALTVRVDKLECFLQGGPYRS